MPPRTAKPTCARASSRRSTRSSRRPARSEVNAIGYCVGGTLLAVDARLHGARRATTASRAATFFTTQVDFTYAGDLKVFVDEEQIAAVEQRDERSAAISTAREMATAFNMLRSNDLIWPYVVNNYLQGQGAAALRPALLELRFDADAGGEPLLLPAQLLSREQRWRRARWSSAGSTLDRSAKVDDPDLQSRHPEDHIAPAHSVFLGSQLLRRRRSTSCWPAPATSPASSTRRRRRNTSSGPAASPKASFEDWLAKAKETPGSWWPHWQAWIEKQDKRRTKARKPGKGAKVLGNAPGTYVKVRV